MRVLHVNPDISDTATFRHFPCFPLFPGTHLVATTRFQPRPGGSIPIVGGAWIYSTNWNRTAMTLAATP